MSETVKFVEISVDLINKIANYLGNRPFNEIADLILSLQGEVQVYSNKIKEQNDLTQNDLGQKAVGLDKSATE
jgi:hypothetical protein